MGYWRTQANQIEDADWAQHFGRSAATRSGSASVFTCCPRRWRGKPTLVKLRYGRRHARWCQLSAPPAKCPGCCASAGLLKAGAGPVLTADAAMKPAASQSSSAPKGLPVVSSRPSGPAAGKNPPHPSPATRSASRRSVFGSYKAAPLDSSNWGLPPGDGSDGLSFPPRQAAEYSPAGATRFGVKAGRSSPLRRVQPRRLLRESRGRKARRIIATLSWLGQHQRYPISAIRLTASNAGRWYLLQGPGAGGPNTSFLEGWHPCLAQYLKPAGGLPGIAAVAPNNQIPMPST